MNCSTCNAPAVGQCCDCKDLFCADHGELDEDLCCKCLAKVVEEQAVNEALLEIDFRRSVLQ